MSKELEALERGILEFEKELEYDCNNEWLKRVIAGMKKCYQRLEAIDNANPSEALKLIGYLKDHHLNAIPYYDWLNDIENYILKQQQPKQYLKWEDLKFTDERQTIKVLLNGKKYFVKYKKEYLFGYYEKVEITNGTFILCTLGNGMKQFFNDLHLERAEE